VQPTWIKNDWVKPTDIGSNSGFDGIQSYHEITGQNAIWNQ